MDGRRLLGKASLLAAVWVDLAGCAGKSDGAKSSGGTSGTSASAGMSSSGSAGSSVASGGSGASATSGSAGNPTSGCEYNGERHELGESFGSCDECVCTPTGGVDCGLGCASGGRGGSMSTGGGRAGMHASGAGGAEGGSPATGGASGAGVGGTAGAGMTAGFGGDLGGGGEPSNVREDCTLQEGQLCVVGTPRGGGHELAEGMPMLFTIQAAGCLSSSCTELASAECNTIGSPHDFYVNGFFCVNVTEGGACTGDCGGTPTMTCDVEQTLEAGEYTVHMGSGSTDPLRFTVPGVIAEEDRCTHPLTF